MEEETIDEQTIQELDNIIGNDEEPATIEENEVEPLIEVSTKLKTRNDYIQTIKDVCDKLGKDQPKALHRKKLKELKEILANLTTEGVQKVNGLETPPNTSNRDDYAVLVLYNLNKFVLNMASNMSKKYENKLGFVVKNPVEKLEKNEEQKEALKTALRGVWDEYKEDLQPYMSPVATLMIINFTIITSSMEVAVKTEEKNDTTIIEV